MKPTEFHRLVSGQSRGLPATLLRAGLRAAEVPYTFAIQLRNHRFDQGHNVVHSVGCPVISVGNLTLGGTGKTPLVTWIAKWFAARSVRIAIVSRGYGASRGRPNDEALELQLRLRHVPHLQGPDRVQIAAQAIEQFNAQVILLDDGFQHRRLARDLDIVLIDALQPFGFGHVFPRGCLREPLEGVNRADVVVLARSDMASPERRGQLHDEVRQHNQHALWIESTHQPTARIIHQGAPRSLDQLSNEVIVAFCGIGNPQAFRRTLATCHCYPQALLEFPDHFSYDPTALDQIVATATRHRATRIVCTVKDLVKIERQELGGIPLEALAIDLHLKPSTDLEAFERKLSQIVAEPHGDNQRA